MINWSLTCKPARREYSKIRHTENIATCIYIPSWISWVSSPRNEDEEHITRGTILPFAWRLHDEKQVLPREGERGHRYKGWILEAHIQGGWRGRSVWCAGQEAEWKSGGSVNKYEETTRRQWKTLTEGLGEEGELRDPHAHSKGSYYNKFVGGLRSGNNSELRATLRMCLSLLLFKWKWKATNCNGCDLYLHPSRLSRSCFRIYTAFRVLWVLSELSCSHQAADSGASMAQRWQSIGFFVILLFFSYTNTGRLTCFIDICRIFLAQQYFP